MHLLFRSHKNTGWVLLKTSEYLPQQTHKQSPSPRSYNKILAWPHISRPACPSPQELGTAWEGEELMMPVGVMASPSLLEGSKECWSYPQSQGYNWQDRVSSYRSASPGLPGLFPHMTKVCRRPSVDRREVKNCLVCVAPGGRMTRPIGAPDTFGQCHRRGWTLGRTAPTKGPWRASAPCRAQKPLWGRRRCCSRALCSAVWPSPGMQQGGCLCCSWMKVLMGPALMGQREQARIPGEGWTHPTHTSR